MPKRRRQAEPERDGGRKARTKRMRRRRPQLYLVLDDWEMGSSIRKIEDPAYACWYAGLQRLPSPIYQLEAPHGYATSFATSLGSKIMVVHPQHNEAQTFDARSRSVIYGPRPHGFPNRMPTFIPFGNQNHRLCALWGGSLQLCEGLSEQGLWSWCKVRDLPFDESHVTSYAVHPDGQTILVSVEERPHPWGIPTSANTFFFNVDDWRSSATENAVVDWSLPFHGRCYFVDELNFWVGLSGSYDSYGRLCACPVVTPDSTRPSWKISKEYMFSNSQVECHTGATLVYMGNKDFCLVECIRAEQSYLCEGQPLNPPPFDFLLPFKDNIFHPLLKLTMFSLMVDENGDLTTGDTRRFQYYSMPGPVSRSSTQCPVAFWM